MKNIVNVLHMRYYIPKQILANESLDNYTYTWEYDPVHTTINPNTVSNTWVKK